MISGYYGFGNAGDEAVLAGIITAIKNFLPEAEITALSANPEETRKLHGIAAVERNMFPKAASRADLFLCGGGSLFQDATSARSALYYLGQFLYCSSIAKAKSVVYGQGIGPLRRGWIRKVASIALNRASLITLRDAESAELLSSIGVRKPRIEVTADPSFALSPIGKDFGKEFLENLGIKSGPVVAVCPRNWGKYDTETELATALRQFTRDFDISTILVPMFSLQDIGMCKRIADSHEKFALLDKWNSFQDVRAAIAGADLVVSTRLHGLIFAVREGVPAVGISYDPKVESFCKMCGLPYLDIGDFSSERVLDTMKAAWEKRDDLSAKEKIANAELEIRAIKNARMALELIEL